MVRIGLPTDVLPVPLVPDGRTIRQDNMSQPEEQAPRSSYRLPTPSNGCTRNSSDASRPGRCCRRRRLPACCSGHCWLPVRLPCGRSTVGTLLPRSRSLNALTLLHDAITSSRRSCRHTNFHQVCDTTEQPRASLLALLSSSLVAYSRAVQRSIHLRGDVESAVQQLSRTCGLTRAPDSGAARSLNLCRATRSPAGCHAVVRSVPHSTRRDS